MSVNATPSKQVAADLAKIDMCSSPSKAAAAKKHAVKEVSQKADDDTEPRSAIDNYVYGRFVGEGGPTRGGRTDLEGKQGSLCPVPNPLP